jgi:hypothetical protein
MNRKTKLKFERPNINTASSGQKSEPTLLCTKRPDHGQFLIDGQCRPPSGKWDEADGYPPFCDQARGWSRRRRCSEPSRAAIGIVSVTGKKSPDQSAVGRCVPSFLPAHLTAEPHPRRLRRSRSRLRLSYVALLAPRHDPPSHPWRSAWG